MTDYFFRSRLDQMIDHRHPLAVLAQRLPWHKIEARLAPQFVHQARPLQQIEDAPDLLGAVVSVSGGKVSNAGRPRLCMLLAPIEYRRLAKRIAGSAVPASQIEKSRVPEGILGHCFDQCGGLPCNLLSVRPAFGSRFSVIAAEHGLFLLSSHRQSRAAFWHGNAKSSTAQSA